MELHQLRYVLAVADTGSFSKAAERLFVVQSNVSAQVRKLEHELGVDLFERRPHEVALTAFGRAFVPRVKDTLAALEDARLALASVRDLTQGRASLGVAGSLVGWLIPEVLRRFRKTWPGIEIQLTEQPSVILASMVAERDIPQAVVQGTAHKPEQLTVSALFEEQLVAILPPGHRLTGKGIAPLETFRRDELLLPELGNQLRDIIIAACESFGFSPIVPIEVSNKQLARELAGKGVAVGILPAMTTLTDTSIDSARIVRITEPSLTRKVGLARKRRTVLAPADEAMGDIVRNVVSEFSQQEPYSEFMVLS